MKALLVIDVQKGLTARKLYEKELFFDTVNSYIDKYKKRGDEVIFVRHENKQLVFGSQEWELDDRICVGEGDKYFAKTKGDAFSSKELREYLESKNVDTVTVCGLVSHGCVKSTVKGALDLGYDAVILKNGHTNWHKEAKNKIESTEKELLSLGASLEG